jgi:DnaJ like chaperone protein
MSITEIFVIVACAFLGFFIVFSMIGSKKVAQPEAEETKNFDDKDQKNSDGFSDSANPDDGAESDDSTKSKNSESNKQSSSNSHSNFEWHTVLGVPAHASKLEVRNAYLTLIQKYHPDKVEMLGVEFKTLADLKSKQINEAYRKYKSIR